MSMSKLDQILIKKPVMRDSTIGEREQIRDAFIEYLKEESKNIPEGTLGNFAQKIIVDKIIGDLMLDQ